MGHTRFSIQKDPRNTFGILDPCLSASCIVGLRGRSPTSLIMLTLATDACCTIASWSEPCRYSVGRIGDCVRGSDRCGRFDQNTPVPRSIRRLERSWCEVLAIGLLRDR